jgi:ferrous iron transport protein A
MHKLNLRHMKPKQSGIIAAISAEGEVGRRLRDMGLVTGTRITVQGRAPLHDPVALRLMGFTLTLRNNEADYIDVEIEE